MTSLGVPYKQPGAVCERLGLVCRLCMVTGLHQPSGDGLWVGRAKLRRNEGAYGEGVGEVLPQSSQQLAV